MRLGVFDNGPWLAAVRALGHDALPLEGADFGLAGDRNARLHDAITTANANMARLRAQPVQALLDADGRGFSFLATAGARDLTRQVEFNDQYRSELEVRVFHHELNLPLVSCFATAIPIRLTEAAAGFDFAALNLESWINVTADAAQAHELRRLGVPAVYYAPPAAPDGDYDTRPIDPDAMRTPLSFVGAAQADGTESPGAGIGRTAAVLARAHQAAAPSVSFFDAYFHVYGLRELPAADASADVRSEVLSAYLAAREDYLALNGLAAHDRPIVFLKRQLGDVMALHGQGWQESYGLAVGPPMPSPAERGAHARRSLINLVLPPPGAERGVSAAAFEIAAAGGFVLALHSPEIEPLFEVGRECDTFRDEGELLEKVRHYLAHPRRCVEIAAAGQRRALAQHLHSHRLAALLRQLDLAQRPPRPVEITTRYFDLTSWIDDVRRVTPEPRVVLDCGAFDGGTARMLRQAFPRAAIYSFEPVAAVYEQLRQAAATLNVTPVRAAVSDEDGTTTLHLTHGGQSASLLGEQAEDNPLHTYTRVIGGEQVPVVRLDTWCERNGIDPATVDVLKMDIQGAELKALRGAPRLLQHVRAIYLEVGFVSIYRDMPLLGDVDRFLISAGFERRALYPSAAPSLWGDALYVKAIPAVRHSRSDDFQVRGNEPALVFDARSTARRSGFYAEEAR